MTFSLENARPRALDGSRARAAMLGDDSGRERISAAMSIWQDVVRRSGRDDIRSVPVPRSASRMTRYLMSVCYSPDAMPPTPPELQSIMSDVTEVHRQLQAEGSWVFGGGLHDPSTATVVTSHNGSPVMTDGPFIDCEEVIGGLSIIDVADLDAALLWPTAPRKPHGAPSRSGRSWMTTRSETALRSRRALGDRSRLSRRMGPGGRRARRHARRPGPWALGPAAVRRSPSPPASLPPPILTRPVPTSCGHHRRARRGRDVRSDRLAPDPGRL